METSYWTPETEASQVFPHQKLSEDLVPCGTNTVADDYLDAAAMAGGYSGTADHYCHELDNPGFGSFDDYFFVPAGKGRAQDPGVEVVPMSKICLKKEGRPTKVSCMESEALPVVPNVKSEYPNSYPHMHCCSLPIGQKQWVSKSSDLSLDTAFSPTSDLGSSCSASPAIALDSPDSGIGYSDTGFEVYHDLIMRHLIQDIQGTCARLNIPRDPKLWTSADSNAWLMDMSAQYHLAQVPYDKLSVDGATLCSMNVGQFSQCFPNGGETVHAQLQIWNSANEYCSRQSTSSTNPAMISVNKEPGTVANEEHQFVQMNPGSVIQRLRNAADDASTAYMYPPQFLLQPQQQEQYGNQVPPPVTYGMGAILPSPGSCSDSGLSIEADYAVMNPNAGCLDNVGRGNSTGNGSNIHLWQFLRELLEQQDKYGQCVRWIDHNAGIFKIEDSHALARLWGKRKNRPAMNYDKLSRSLRQYYKKNILKKTTRSQRLVYQFMHPYHVC